MDGEINDAVNALTNPADQRKELARLIFQAAEMRSQGYSWAAVGRAVGREPETVRRWPKRFANRWRKGYRLAVSANVTAASAEAMQLLRQELRGESPRVRCDSAKAILRFHEWRRWRQAKYPKPMKKYNIPERELKEMEKYYAMTPDQRREYAREWQQRYDDAMR